jgi:hypothetical protein
MSLVCGIKEETNGTEHWRYALTDYLTPVKYLLFSHVLFKCSKASILHIAI